MISRVYSRLLRLALGIVVVLLLLLAVSIWYLDKHPISLNLLTPYVETLLPSSLDGLQVDVQDVVLAWHRGAKRMVLSARDVHLREPQGIIDATIPNVDVTLSVRALLRQRTASLHNVYIDGAQLHLNAAAVKSETMPPLAFPTPPDIVKAVESVINIFDDSSLLSALHTVRVINSEVMLYHTASTQPVHLSDLAITLDRAPTQIDSELNFTTSLADTEAEFKLDLSYKTLDHQLIVKSQFVNLRPSDLVAVDPTLSELSGFSMPFTGSLNLVLHPQAPLPAAEFDIQGGSGQVRLANFYRDALQIKKFAARGHFDGATETLRIDHATLALGAGQHSKPRLHLQSSMTGLRHPTRIEGDVTLTDCTMADLETYWPQGLAPGPRKWITQHIPQGLVQETKAHFVLGASKEAQPTLVVQEIAGTMQYEGLEVHYLRPLPPIQHAVGKGHFNRSGFHFEVARGELEKMALANGNVDITGLDRRKPAIAIRTGISGELQEALTLLNHPRLHLMAGLHMPLETVTGQFQAEPNFAFALRKPLRIEDVEINVQGILQDVSVQKLALDQDLSNGQLRLDLDKRHMTIAGQAEWATIPFSFTWESILSRSKTTDWRNRLHAVIPRMGHAGRARFGYDLSDLIEGPMAVVVDMQTTWDKQQTVDLQFDLRETGLHLPWLNWHKPTGEPAQAAAKLQLADKRLIALSDLQLDTDDLKARGSAQFNGTTLERIEFPHVVFGNSDLRDVAFQLLHPGLAISIDNGFLDTTPLRQLLAKSPTPPKTDDKPSRVTFPLQLNVPHLHRVQITPERYLSHVSAHLARHGQRWDAITVAGQIPDELTQGPNSKPSDAKNGKKIFDFRYLPTATEQPNLSLQTNDIGALLRALDLSDNYIGGDLTLSGRTNKEGTGLKTHVQATQFIARQAPVMARVLAAASLQGIANLLSSDGLKFDALKADLTLYDERLKIAQANAHGGALGVTAKGNVVYETGVLDVQGTIIPAYLLNSILGHVPVVNLLVGGKGQGLVAVDYYLTGKLADPQVSVNPISALTPGFLRGIFDLFQPINEGNTPSSASESAPEDERPIEP